MELDPRKQDPAHPAWRVLVFALMIGYLTFISWLNASNFDETELSMLGWWGIGALALLFAPELAKKLLGGKD